MEQSPPGASRGLLHYLRHEATYRLTRARQAVQVAVGQRRKRRLFDQWIARLEENPPDVFLGANIDARAGLRNHLVGIRRYSSLRVELGPPDDLLELLSYPDFHTTFRDRFRRFRAPGIRSIHSHVYPYFIEWCRDTARDGIQWVHTYHSPYFPTYEGDPLEEWQREINRAAIEVGRYADVRLSVSRWQQEWLENEHGITTSYMPNGVDVELCSKADASRFASICPARNFVLYVGRNDPVKNPRDFLRLAGGMDEKHFVVIGDGLDRGSVIPRDRDTSPNVYFLGAQPRACVQDALAACSVLVITSLWEGLPTLVLEALLQGATVVVPDNAGCMEAVGGGRYGLIYRQGDIEDLARCVTEACAAGRGAFESRDRVLGEYDWRVIAPRLDAIYRQASP